MSQWTGEEGGWINGLGRREVVGSMGWGGGRLLGQWAGEEGRLLGQWAGEEWRHQVISLDGGSGSLGGGGWL